MKDYSGILHPSYYIRGGVTTSIVDDDKFYLAGIFQFQYPADRPPDRLLFVESTHEDGDLNPRPLIGHWLSNLGLRDLQEEWPVRKTCRC